jgi:hypothetical protein
MKGALVHKICFRQKLRYNGDGVSFLMAAGLLPRRWYDVASSVVEAARGSFCATQGFIEKFLERRC